MNYPELRLRRLRRTPAIRMLVRETRLDVTDLVYPLFVRPGRGEKEPVPSLPGVFRFSPDLLLEEVAEARELGLSAVLLFGIPASKDEAASEAYSENAVVPEAVRLLKERFPDLVVITDVCLCSYTSHGHCGVVRGGEVDNDATLPLLARMARAHARAGADFVAPSDMMDGRIGFIRKELDAHGFSHVGIISYAAKFASAFYGPFREAASSAPAFGDRRSYQMDPPNAREALREVLLDVAEGADMVMVKPALPYLDVIKEVRAHVLCPVVAYNVSGEYALVKAAAALGSVDEERAIWEILTGIKRAGADLIITYHAKEAARLLRAGW